VVFDICEETDRHTDTLTVLCAPHEGKVITEYLLKPQLEMTGIFLWDAD